MSVCLLGYDSALAIYRQLRDHLGSSTRLRIPLNDAEPNLRPISQTRWPAWLERRRPAHLIVKSNSSHRSSSHVVTHVWGTTYSEWPVLDLGNDVFVSAPEFLFLQMALVLQPIELVFLGYELCGRFGFDPSGQLLSAPPITSVDHIKAFLETATSARGSGRASWAIRNVLDNSASPMETALAMDLTLSHHLGGYGLTNPLLNQRLYLGEDSGQMLGRDVLTPDLLWPEDRLAVEYDSVLHHATARDIARDAQRRDVYSIAGYEVITVSGDHMKSVVDLDRIAFRIARTIGKRLRYTHADDRVRRAELQRTTFALAIAPERLTWLGRGR